MIKAPDARPSEFADLNHASTEFVELESASA
jgi:hypothetical protein